MYVLHLHPFKRLTRSVLFTIAVFALLFAASASASVSAHPLSVSNTALQVTADSLLLQFSIDDLSVIESVPGVDRNRDEALEDSEVSAGQSAIGAWVADSLTLKADGTALQGRVIDIALLAKGGKRMVVSELRYDKPASASAVTLQDKLYTTDNNTTYVNLLVVRSGSHVAERALNGSGSGRLAAFTVDDRGIRWSTTGDGVSGGTASGANPAATGKGAPASSEAPSSSDSGASDSAWYSFFLLGMHHILTGYDHLLFLLALLLRKQPLLDYVKIATAFTLAHSLTLTLAVLGWNPMPGKLVEILIALSIVYVAVENMMGWNRGRRWQLTFAFGLVHGLGFAGILAELDIPKSHLAASLVSFNVGIEVMQIGLIAAASPFLALFQRSRIYPRGYALGSTAIIAVGGFWVVERLL
ncbi:HupE/UreJ family protein [Paenibacillus koleovorans]|uniref:HupE/UreJ family protein n=1 Tax=Paenibacillus koleovorans TaxID=121608 RepID=UPI000FD9B941|nr:HupE/UreJ family protein [Paenibacillus koleovorans]